MSDSLKSKVEEWRVAQEASKKAKLHPKLKTYKFDEDNVTLVLMGDTHIGARQYRRDEHLRNLEWCYEEEAKLILMGDQLETALRDSVGAGVYEQDEHLQGQMEEFVGLYKPLADKELILGIHGGNHEDRITQRVALDVTEMMCKELGVPHFDWGQYTRLRVGDQGYTLYTTHGHSGAQKAHTKIKAAIDLEHMAKGADIYAMGHLHQLSHHVAQAYRPDLRRGTIETVPTHFLITGAYLDHWNSYAHRKSMQPARIGSPKVKLKGDERSIRVSL
jgi:predicted phosphodiesterase